MMMVKKRMMRMTACIKECVELSAMARRMEWKMMKMMKMVCLRRGKHDLQQRAMATWHRSVQKKELKIMMQRMRMRIVVAAHA
jgi:hypothetical protein